MVCRGKCVLENDGKRVYYELGYKRCSECCKNLKTDADKCYCCNKILRGGAQSGKARKNRILMKVRNE